MWLMWRKADRPIQVKCDGNWAAIPTAGTKQTGMQCGCYNGLTLREQGAPEGVMHQVPICTPAEIGK